MDEQLNITATSGKEKEKEGKPIDKLLSLINKNTNRKGTETTKRLDAILATDNKILEAVSKIKSLDKSSEDENSKERDEEDKERKDAKKERDENRKERKKKKDKKDKDKDDGFRSKLAGLFDNLSGTLARDYGLVGKVLSLPAKGLGNVIRPKEEDDNVESQEESKDRAVEEKERSKWDKFRNFVMEKLGLLDEDKTDEEPKEEKKKKGLGLGGLAVMGIGAALAGVGSKIAEMWENGIGATVQKDMDTFKKRWAEGDYLGMIMHPIDSLVALAGMAGEVIGDGITFVKNKLISIWDGIVETAEDIVDGIFDLWPSFLGGRSKEEKEARKQEKETRRALKAKGMSNSEIESFNKTNERRKAMNESELTPEEFMQYAHKGIEGAGKATKAANKPAAKTAKSVSKPQVASKTAPTTIEKPEAVSSESTDKKSTAPSTNTVIIKESQSGVEVSDYIGTPSSVVSTMTRT